jgi:AcrR family transcriptional regulator
MPSSRKRPARGRPAQTRARLVAAASRAFEREGYHGTDSNKIARAAGYAPGTFYKHFEDKKAIFLAAYEAWVSGEWEGIAGLLEQVRPPERLAEALVLFTVRLHKRTRGFRASLRALVAVDEEVRTFQRAQRRRQLELMKSLRTKGRLAPRSDEESVLVLYTMERVCDALADGEIANLGLSERETVRLLERMLAAHLTQRRPC